MKQVMNDTVTTTIKAICLVAMVLFLAGCKVELYSGLQERESNEMLSILLDHDIPSEKLLDKDKLATLIVDANDVSRSIKVLNSLGFPKERYSSIGDIFPKDGLISSPTEERARYTYSMSQELSSTLSMIDGVVTARVHVVLPQESDSLTDVTYPSSASVFIKYTSELELSGFIPKIKTLVANSIEGLSLDKITVSLFPATRLNMASMSVMQGLQGGDSESGSISISSNRNGFVILLSLLGLLFFAAVVGGGYYYYRNNYMKKSDSTE